MWSDSRFWTIAITQAKDTLELTDCQLRALPQMYIFPDKRYSCSTLSWPVTILNAAKELAAQIHGADELRIKIEKACALDRSLPRSIVSQYPRDYVNDPALTSSLKLLDCIFPRFGAFAFPSLVDGRVENGLWCSGCAGCEARPNRQSRAALMDVRYKYEYARSEAEFLEHARQCKGVPELMATD